MVKKIVCVLLMILMIVGVTTANADDLFTDYDSKNHLDLVAKFNASYLVANAREFEVRTVEVMTENGVKYYSSAFQAIEIFDSYMMGLDMQVTYFGEKYAVTAISDEYNIYLVFVENNVTHYLVWDINLNNYAK